MSDEMTPEQRAERALDRILNGVGMKYAISDQIRSAIDQERERCAKIAEGGRFLHDDAPDARFGKACAAAIRREPEEEDAEG